MGVIPIGRVGAIPRVVPHGLDITGKLGRFRSAAVTMGETFRLALDSLRPVSLELVENLGQRRHVHQLLQRYHYRGYSGAVGENVQYLAREARGRELAVMVFGVAAVMATLPPAGSQLR